MRKHVQERQARKLAEGQQDMQNRCTFCKKALTGWIEDFIMPGRFCDDECMASAAEAEEQRKQMEARR